MGQLGEEHLQVEGRKPKMGATRLFRSVLVMAFVLVLSTANEELSKAFKKKLDTQFPQADLNKNGKVCVGEYTTFMTPKIIEYYKKAKICTMEKKDAEAVARDIFNMVSKKADKDGDKHLSMKEASDNIMHYQKIVKDGYKKGEAKCKKGDAKEIQNATRQFGGLLNDGVGSMG